MAPFWTPPYIKLITIEMEEPNRTWDPKLRCKLYQMDSAEEWQCLGIGYAEVVGQNSGTVQLAFWEEEAGRLVYSQPLHPAYVYERQESNIICWYNMATDEPEMAFSFQNVGGTDVIWGQLKGANDSLGLNLRMVEEKEEGVEVYEEDSQEGRRTEATKSAFPIPSLLTLEDFEADLQGKVSLHLLLSHNTLDALKNIFAHLESQQSTLDKEQKENFDMASNARHLQTIFRVMRYIVGVAEQDLLEYLLSDHYHLFLFSALEYDLELQQKRPVSHRQFFTQTLRFHPVAKIDDPEILRLIHLTYRLQYLKDCVLGHFLNERTLGIITIMVHNNYIEVIRHIQTRKSVMSSLMEQLRNNNLLALRMVNEICMLLKGLEIYGQIDKDEFYDSLNEYNIYELLEDTLLTQDMPAQQLALEIINFSVMSAPQYLRRYVVSNIQRIQKFPLFSLLCQLFSRNHDDGVQLLLKNIITNIIVDQVEVGADQTNMAPIQEYFYLTQLHKILAQADQAHPELHNDLLHILAGALRHFSYPLKTAILQNNLLDWVFKDLLQKNKVQILKSLQIFTEMVLLKDEELNIFLEEQVEGILALVEHRSCRRQALIFSQLLHLVKVIYKSNVEGLVGAVEKGPSSGHANWSALQELVARHKQLSEVYPDGRAEQEAKALNGGVMSQSSQSSSHSTTSNHSNLSSNSSESQGKRRLVDYDEDEDQKDYIHKALKQI